MPGWEIQETEWCHHIMGYLQKSIGPSLVHNYNGSDTHRIVVDLMFNQMTASKGIKLFGERAILAVLEEYRQLYNMEVFSRINVDKLTMKQKRQALRSINLIKEKRCGKIKGSTCVDGSSQRAYVSREEATSPTVSLEGLLTTLAIDAHEGRDFAIFDALGVYLNIYMLDDKLVIIKFEGQFVDIMCQM